MPKRKINCIECGEKLTGRKIRFCSDKCRKRYTRREDKNQTINIETVPPVPELPPGVPLETPQPPIVSVAKAASSEDTVETLRALRNKLALEIDLSEHPRDLAVLSARLMDTLDKLEQKTNGDKKTAGGALDELNKRRAARRSSGA